MIGDSTLVLARGKKGEVGKKREKGKGSRDKRRKKRRGRKKGSGTAYGWTEARNHETKDDGRSTAMLWGFILPMIFDGTAAHNAIPERRFSH